MRRLVLLASLFVLPSFALACSSSSDAGSTAIDDAGDGTDTATDDSAAAADTGSAADTATASDAPATAPKTPTITGLMQMAGGLHVTWKLNDTGLSSVELWRKDGAGTYAKVYTLPGTATSQHDAKANVAGTTYCFQVKTIRAGMESQFSPEKCGTP